MYPSLKNRLELAGWKDVSPKTQFGVEFDLVGHRRFLFMTNWNLLVKNVDVLSSEEIERWKASFQLINEASKDPSDERCFLLCLIARKVSSDLSDLVKARDSFGLASVIRRVLDAASFRGGGGNIFILDQASRTIHGTVPLFPYDVRKYSQQMLFTLRDLLTGEGSVPQLGEAKTG